MDAAGLAECLRAMLAVVRDHESELNRLNVFPVRDHDTGTNMALTLEGVVKAADASAGLPLRELAGAVAGAATMEARGNSGIILAEVICGLFETWAPLDRVGGADLARGFRAAARRADQAMLEPVEGTIITVVREAADALAELPEGDPAAMLAAAAERTGRAVERTRDQLETLRQAGVVDAAARGFELCLRAFAATAAGQAAPHVHATAAPEPRDGPDTGPAFEVQYLLACDELQAEELKRALAAIGSSIAVARRDGLYRVHVHTDDAGAAIEEAIGRGRISRIQVAYLRADAAAD
jgi:hypothetical protein